MRLTALILAGLCFFSDGCCRLSADEPVIVFPTIETPEPEPVTPKIVDTVTAGVWYVIQSEQPLQVRHYPGGMLAVHAFPGPATFLGMYPDSQKIEVHRFSLAHIYVLQPVDDGKTTLVLTTVHNEQVHVIEQPLTVSLKGPRPPPGPVLNDVLARCHEADRKSQIEILRQLAAKNLARDPAGLQMAKDFVNTERIRRRSDDFGLYTDAIGEAIFGGTVSELADTLEGKP